MDKTNNNFLLAALKEVQKTKGYISDADMQNIADRYNISPVKVYSVASFYHFFNIEKGALHNIYIPNCICNEMAGIKSIVNELEKELNIKVGEITNDKKFALRYTSCIGMCDYAPSLLIDGVLIPNVTVSKVKDLIKKIDNIENYGLLKNYHKVQREGKVLFSKIGYLEGLKKAVNLGKDTVLKEVIDSGIRGRGGAGFPTGLKWQSVASMNDTNKFIICNADEGEPGTFKDRVLIVEYPELFIEGMIIAAFCTGAKQGIIYLREEYVSLYEILQNTIDKMYSNNALGKNILGKQDFDFDIKIVLGAGAYVCGEETALIESLQGNRGEPRSKPPYPVTCGYNYSPTVVNNVETFANIPHILVKGSEFFKSLGTPKSTGTKLVSVSGDCKKPGVYEIEFGIKIKELLNLVEADSPYAVCSGATGELVEQSNFDRVIAFEDFSTGGSVIVVGKNRSLFDVICNHLTFLEEESCGQCTPCREGLPVLVDGLELLKQNKCEDKYLKDLLSLTETMQLASKCGLGQSAPTQFVNLVNLIKKGEVN